ncbi:MFS transporter [Schumannella soli]|uniref:MFS transporter n=1 Tax=Schumannella soli TaxID=2590779 RepID=A0A506Y4T6_9MICO|nr:MFS transporter [Schumannella soli]TPW77606.1 MFS transporter [Schumannella soli]
MSDPRDDSIPAEPVQPADPSQPAEQRVRIRRAPKLGVFMLVGAVLGALVSLILTSTQKADPAIGFAATAGYFAIYGVVGGVLIGALLGLIADRVSRRRAHYVVMEREVVEEPEYDAELEPAADDRTDERVAEFDDADAQPVDADDTAPEPDLEKPADDAR